MTDVLTPNMVRIDGKQYRIEHQVTASLSTPFAAKVVTGEYNRDSEPLRSTWNMENFGGGLGIELMDVQRTQDRYDFGSADTAIEKQVMLPPRPILSITDAPANTSMRVFATYNNKLYAAWNEFIRYWSDATSAWIEPEEGSYVDLSAAGTNALTVRLGGSNWLVICDGSKFLKFDGTTWTLVAGNGSTIPQAQYLQTWDNRLWALDLNNKLWVTTDLSTWTAKATLPLVSGETTGLKVFFDKDNNEALHAPTREGLWIYDSSADVWRRTRLKFPRHRHGGEGNEIWRDTCYLSAGLDVYSYSGSAVSPMGPSRDWGIPQDFQGYIKVLVDAFNWLVAGINAFDTQELPVTMAASGRLRVPTMSRAAGASCLLRWTGSAWHPLWQDSVITDGLECLGVSTAGSMQRLWWSVGSNAYYISLPEGIWNPKRLPNWEFDDFGYLITSRWDGGWSEQTKTVFELIVKLLRADSEVYVDVYYGINNAEGWTFLARVDNNDGTPIPFNLKAGLPLKNIRFKYELFNTSGDPTRSPILDFAVLTMMRRPRQIYGYALSILMNQTFDGRTPGKQLRDLKAALAKEEAIEFLFHNEENEIVTRYVVAPQVGGALYAGPDDRGRVQLSLVDA